MELEAVGHNMATVRRKKGGFLLACFSMYTFLKAKQVKGLFTVGGSSHLTEHNQNNPPQVHPESLSQVILDSVKSVINTNTTVNN